MDGQLVLSRTTDIGHRRGRRPAPRGVAAVSFAHFAVDFAAGAFVATLPATVDGLGGGGAAFGIVVALFSVTALGLQPVLGRFADRFGLRTTTALAGAVSAVLLMAAIAAPNIPVLVLATIGGGLAAGAFHPAGAALTRVVTTGTPEAAVASFAAAGTIGLAVGPIAGIALVDWSGHHLSTLILALPALAVAVLLAGSDARTTAAPPAERLPLTNVVRALGPTAGVATLVSVAATAISSTVPLLIAAQPGATRTDMSIGIALATFSLALALGGLLGSVLVSRVAPDVVLPVGLVVGAVAGGIALSTGPAGSSFFALLAVTGVAIGPAIPVLLVAAQDQLPESRAAASGVVLGLANGIAGVAFMIIATTHGALGLEAGALLAMVGLVPAAALARVSAGRRPHPRRPLCQATTSCGCALPGLQVAAP